MHSMTSTFRHGWRGVAQLHGIVMTLELYLTKSEPILQNRKQLTIRRDGIIPKLHCFHLI